MSMLAPVLALLLAGAPASSPAATHAFLIVNPSGRGNQALAQGFLQDFAAAMKASWPSGSTAPPYDGHYHVTEADSVASIKRHPPDFALVSAGFYMAHRKDLHLVPIAQPVRPEGVKPVVHVVTTDGCAVPIATMRLGGQLAGEPAWVRGPVLHLAKDATPTFVPLAKTLEAVRQLQAGQLDGVLMTDADWQLLQKSGKASGLRIAFTSERLPEGPVVTLGEDGPDRAAIVAALKAFPQNEAGRKALQRMSLAGFRDASATDYASLESVFDLAR